MLRLLTAALVFAAAPAFADHKGKSADHHRTHEHQSDSTSAQSDVAVAADPKILAAVAAGGELIIVDVLGVVCDFCSTAMNKTFMKREEVAASAVDLDTKTLSLALKPGETLDDKTIRKLVVKAGYKAAGIRRGEEALKAIEPPQADETQGDA